MTVEESTRSLVRKAKTGDRAAFEQLVDRYRSRLEALVGARVGSHLKQRVELEDIVQETLVKALESVERFQWRGEDSFFHWLSGIAQNLILHLARQHLRVEKVSFNHEVAAGEDSPGKELRRKERFDRLQEALKKLSPDHRQVILLARIDSLPVAEIAERMNRSPKAVHQLLWRALQKLRATFGETESFRLPDLRLRDGGVQDEK